MILPLVGNVFPRLFVITDGRWPSCAYGPRSRFIEQSTKLEVVECDLQALRVAQNGVRIQREGVQREGPCWFRRYKSQALRSASQEVHGERTVTSPGAFSESYVSFFISSTPLQASTELTSFITIHTHAYSTFAGAWRSRYPSSSNTNAALERLIIAALTLHELSRTPISRKVGDVAYVGRMRELLGDLVGVHEVHLRLYCVGGEER